MDLSGLGCLVRVASPADFEAVASLTADVYIGEGFSPSSAGASLRDVAVRAGQTRLFVAVRRTSSEVIGAVSLVREGSTFRQVGRPGELEVRLLAVRPEARASGAGRALMDAVVDDARSDCARVVLSTQPSMEAAQRLYRRMGFSRDPSRDWLRPNGREMLVYVLDL